MPERPRWYKRIKLVGFLWKKWSERKAKPEKISKPRTYKPIHLATLLVLAVFALAITGVAAWFMWNAAQVPARFTNSPDLAVRAAQLRVDVIRNILAVGAGAGGLIALFVALRRQYVKERVDHTDQEHKNRTAEDTKHDAAERRVTELYTKAAEQLGSEKAPVRMAALYALERMGQGNPEHRQTIVNLICAYLRMPFEVPAGWPELLPNAASDQVERYQELQVRMAAQDILNLHFEHPFHLHIGTADYRQPPDSYWGELNLDLARSVLVDLSLAYCVFRDLNFRGAHFVGSSTFTGLATSGTANFAEATFDGFSDFTFARLSGSFSDATFSGAVRFDRIDVSWFLTFRRTVFKASAQFDRLRGEVPYLLGARAVIDGFDQHSWPHGYQLVPNAHDAEMGDLHWIGDQENEEGAKEPLPSPRYVDILPHAQALTTFDPDLPEGVR
ncbi:pentapeptide repeat-containing protein [Micromonospora sp. NPDC049204]|uniref:pentapeptide repeat-containing protein n=1 Tax=Micromonospora sp. NPDC049204 TaxID=3154351 RepID=UPI0033FBBC56